MVTIISFLFFAFLISISNEGSCAITTRADKYIKCRDKNPTDIRNNVCCFFHYKNASGGNNKICVEMRGVDLKKERFKEVKEQIKAGKYDYWLMDNYTGFEAYKENITISKIESLRCNNCQYLKYFGLLAILLILY